MFTYRLHLEDGSDAGVPGMPAVMALFSAGRSLGYANHPLSQSRREAGGLPLSPMADKVG